MADQEHHAAGNPPPVTDEAADTPMWIPALGLAILLALVTGALIIDRSEDTAADQTTDDAPALEVVVVDAENE